MFSGNSLRNRDWIYEARAQLAGLVDEAYIQDYKHWQTGANWIDLPYELEAVKRQGIAGDYGIFAKSIGTVLAVQAISQKIISPRFLLFCGLPLDYIKKDYPEFAAVLAQANLPLTVVHNEDDKVGRAETVREYLAEPLSETDYKFIETPGDTHDYEDYELLRSELKQLMEQA